MQSKIFTIRFNSKQFDDLSNEANQSKMKVGELIRYKVGFENKANSKQIIFLLGKTSNNINQIAKGINIANLANRINDVIYTQTLARLALTRNEFNNIYTLMKKDQNAN